MHAPRFALVAILTAFICMIVSQSALALPIINGPLTGDIQCGCMPTSNAGLPPGWSVLAGSPDTMDENNNVGVSGGFAPFVATPSPSPDGGTWIGFFSGDGGLSEIFGQTIVGFSIGTVYTVSWYQANFGYSSSTNPDAIGLSVDSVLVGSGSFVPLAPGWTSESVEFTATAVSHELSFGGSTGDNSYISIDGISVSVVPEPSAAVLIGLGLAGLSAARKRTADSALIVS